MSLGFDLTVSNYSIDDLLTLLGLDSNPTIPEVNNKLNIFINMFSDVSNNNTQAIINFFEEVGQRLNEDLFNNSVVESVNDLNFSNNDGSERNNYMSESLQEPIGDNINPLDLIVCKNTEEFINQMNTARDIIESNPNFREKHFNYEFTVPEDGTSNSNIEAERTIFKYDFPTTLTNVSDLYLASIHIKLPYTISEYRNNNKFTIVDNNSSDEFIIDVSYDYIVSNYSLTKYIDYLNLKYFENVDNSNNILGSIRVSLNEVTASKKELSFDLSSVTIANGTYTDFNLIFDQSAVTSQYFLNNILGLDASYISVTNIRGNPISTSNPSLYFSINDNKVNYTQNLVISNSKLKGKNILAKLLMPSVSDLISNDFMIHAVYSISDVTQNSRDYDGFVNLNSFTVRFYDSYGILQQIPEEDFNNDNFTFILKVTQLVADINSG